MSYSDIKITQADIANNNVRSASDILIGNADDNKAVFDKLPEFIAGKHNDLVDALEEVSEHAQGDTEEIDRLSEEKVNVPKNGTDLDFGEAGQMLTTKGNGETQWEDAGQPTDEQTQNAINNWLDAHPEATTTVEDGSLTYNKLVKGTLGFVTPEMFGAVGDGTTDDTNAIEACIDYALSNGVNDVVFSNGKTYLVGSDWSADSSLIVNGIFSYSNISGLNIIGNEAFIKDARQIEQYRKEWAVFKFTDCSNISIVGLNYIHDDYSYTLDNFDDIGYIYVQFLGDCVNIKCHYSTRYCRWGVGGSYYDSSDLSLNGVDGLRNADIKINAVYTAYPVVIHHGCNLDIDVSANEYHRMAYLAGVNTANVKCIGKTNSSYSSSAVIFEDTVTADSVNVGCSNLNIYCEDLGSNYPAGTPLVVMSSYTSQYVTRYNSIKFTNIRIKVVLSENSKCIGFGMDCQNQPDIYDDIVLSVNDYAVDVATYPVLIRFTQLQAQNIVGKIVLRDIYTKRELFIGNKAAGTIAIENSNLGNVYIINSDGSNPTADNETIIFSNCSADRIASNSSAYKIKTIILINCAVVNTVVSTYFKYLSQTTPYTQYGATTERPTGIPLGVPIFFYDTTLNALLVHQGNYWYKLAERGGDV